MDPSKEVDHVGETINARERAGGRGVRVGLGWEGARGGWVKVHTPGAHMPSPLGMLLAQISGAFLLSMSLWQPWASLEMICHPWLPPMLEKLCWRKCLGLGDSSCLRSLSAGGGAHLRGEWREAFTWPVAAGFQKEGASRFTLVIFLLVTSQRILPSCKYRRSFSFILDTSAVRGPRRAYGQRWEGNFPPTG